MSSFHLQRAAFVLLVGAGLSACSSMGTVVDDSDPEAELPNLSMGRSIMEGLGAVPSRRSPINYTPRAPLVIPKDKSALAEPQNRNAVVASNPNWPVDPDEESLRLLREADAREKARDDKNDLIPAGELLATRAPPTGRAPPPGRARGDLSLDSRLLKPSELDKAQFSGAPSTLYDANGQPVRRALTEPPVTYLEPAPGVPVAIPEEPKKETGLFRWLSW